MKIGRFHSTKKTIAQVLLLVLPTIVLTAFLIWRLNSFYSILNNAWLKQTVFFSIGLFSAVVFYSFRFRVLTTTLVLLLLNFGIYKILGSISMGEFDAFYFSVQFLIFNILFTGGWICGFGFSRSRYFTLLLSSIFLLIQLVLVSKTSDFTASGLINTSVPILAYTFYIIYTAELIRNMNEDEPRVFLFIMKRMSGFAILLLVIFFVVFQVFSSKFEAVEKEWGGASTNKGKGNDGGESMTEKGKDGGLKNKDQSKLSGSLNKDKQLIFVARLDNYFYDGRTPNPLYFTSHYYTKFDTATQTFEIDDKVPYNDLFSPDPSQIPMYFRKIDQNIIKNSLATKSRKIVSADIYKVLLSPSSFLAPSTAFYCQPVTVPKEYREQYKSAYTAKMWVSELNSAYFIYNPAGNYQLERFQESRFEELRKVKKIKGPDQKFMDYYTYMPKDDEYKKITRLADSVTSSAETPIDKVIAIRDYFLSKDEFDQPLYAYSDNPGIPGLPSANKLTYFLFENKKGYCAYFAGATLFMLRSLGIPSRVVAGYSITDRSSKNPGWYWFYQDQAHAWVQVFFQEYGWIDFDTTVPDVNTQQAAQPDGTPPTDMPQNYFVADGELVEMDTLKRSLLIRSNTILYHDTEFVHSSLIELPLDVSIANFSCDTGQIRLSQLHKGDRLTAVSHAEVLKSIYTLPQDNFISIINKLPKPIPVDEIKLMNKEESKKEQKKEEEKKEAFQWMRFLKFTLMILGIFLLLFFLSPQLIWWYLHAKAKGEGRGKAFFKYRAIYFYLNQLGLEQGSRTPYEFAVDIDKQFNTEMKSFSQIYQKMKYAGVTLNEKELEKAEGFYLPFIREVKKHYTFSRRSKYFMNVYHTINYFIRNKNN